MKKSSLSAGLALLLILQGFLVLPAFAQTYISSQPAQYLSSCPSLSFNLYRGLRDPYTQGQVSALQQFLASLGYNQPVTGYFGTLTFANVANFQRQHSIYPVTGGVGPLTRAAIAQMCGTQTSGNFSASPTSGAAPLTVSFSASGLTTGQSYIVAFGDGSTGMLSVSNPPCTYGAACAPVGYAAHTYQTPGTYVATLSPYIACMYTNPRCMIATQNLGQVTIVVGGQTVGGLTVTSPTSGQSYARGSSMLISWSYPVTPGSASMVIDLYTASGSKVGTIAVNQSTIGSYTWGVPPFPNNMMCTMQYPNALCGTNIAPGQYYIQVSATSGSGLDQNATVYARGQSGIFNIY